MANKRFPKMASSKAFSKLLQHARKNTSPDLELYAVVHDLPGIPFTTDESLHQFQRMNRLLHGLWIHCSYNPKNEFPFILDLRLGYNYGPENAYLECLTGHGVTPDEALKEIQEKIIYRKTNI